MRYSNIFLVFFFFGSSFVLFLFWVVYFCFWFSFFRIFFSLLILILVLDLILQHQIHYLFLGYTLFLYIFLFLFFLVSCFFLVIFLYYLKLFFSTVIWKLDRSFSKKKKVEYWKFLFTINELNAFVFRVNKLD